MQAKDNNTAQYINACSDIGNSTKTVIKFSSASEFLCISSPHYLGLSLFCELFWLNLFFV